MKQCDFMVSVPQLVPLQSDEDLRYLRPLIDNPAQCHVELIVHGPTNLIELHYILNKDGPTFHKLFPRTLRMHTSASSVSAL